MSISYDNNRDKNLNYNYYSRKGNEPFYDTYTGELVNDDDFEDVDEYDESDFSDVNEGTDIYYDTEEDKFYSDNEFEDIDEDDGEIYSDEEEDIEYLNETKNYTLPFQYRNKLSHDYIRNKYYSYVDLNKEHFLSKYK